MTNIVVALALIFAVLTAGNALLLMAWIGVRENQLARLDRQIRELDQLYRGE